VKVAAERAEAGPEPPCLGAALRGALSGAGLVGAPRLYSEEDIQAVRWIREHTKSGPSVRQAAELFKGNRSELER
jgi:hypothetical protein